MSGTTAFEGWLLDAYADPQDGATLWLMEGEGGPRRRLRLDVPVTFYAAGDEARLAALANFIRAQPAPSALGRATRRDLFVAEPRPLLSVSLPNPLMQEALFREVSRAFPDLDYYDADVNLMLRLSAVYGLFPLARCRGEADSNGRVLALEALDTQWDLDPLPAPLRVMNIDPDVDPAHDAPRALRVRHGGHEYTFPLDKPRPLLINLRALLEGVDPDILLTGWGDTWLLPRLFELSAAWNLLLPLNRHAGRSVEHREARSYFSYGQIVFRGAQIHLFGRCHIDRRNATLWSDYELDGLLESARVTALPIQTAARTSPGTGISAMQMLTALKLDILVPWHKQAAEQPKTALDLLHVDQGGLIYQPTPGLHRDVGEIDFISMYPSIMVKCNISPEKPLPTWLGSDEAPGLIPQTLDPLLRKRVALKMRMAKLPRWDPRSKADRARSSAHKWLLVTCFGYLGYKNARFGRIEAHEAVTTWGREALLRAKEAAEDLGFTVLHMYVDGVWVKKEGATQPEDFQPLLDEVYERTGLPIALDGVMRWVAFLPSRVNGDVPVPNRYFGVFANGELKVRGLEARRRDTAPFITQVQMDMLRSLAGVADEAEGLAAALGVLRRGLARLAAGRVPLPDLLMAQKMSRELKAYKGHSTAAIAARQLLAAGRELRPGQRARYLLMRGDPEVHAWDLPQPPDPRRVDLGRYRVLMLRAAAGVLQPFGVAERALVSLLDGSEAQAELPMLVPTGVYSDVVEEWQPQPQPPQGVIEVLPV